MIRQGQTVTACSRDARSDMQCVDLCMLQGFEGWIGCLKCGFKKCKKVFLEVAAESSCTTYIRMLGVVESQGV